MKFYIKPKMEIRKFNFDNVMTTDASNVNGGNLTKINDYSSINNKLKVD